MERDRGRLHRSLAVLAAPRRFQLLLLVLSGRDRSVSQLARAVRLSQSCTTRHLQALERAGLVKGWRDGKRVVFRPEPRDEAAQAVLASLAPDARERAPGIAVGTGPGVGQPEPSRAEPDASELMRRAAALGAIAVASAAELEPMPAADVPEPARETGPGSGAQGPAGSRASRPRRPRRAKPDATAREEPESGMKSAPPPAARYWSEIEDYLL